MRTLLILFFLQLSLWASIGSVMAMRGSAELKRSNGLIKLENAMEIESADTIITHEKSRVQVMLLDSTVITIGENSEFRFDEFAYDGTKESKASMSSSRGFFRSVTGEIGKIAPERFKVKTASATIGIRGTDFSGEILGEREVFRCYSGAIYIDFEGGFREIEAGMMLELHAAGAKERVMQMNTEGLKESDDASQPELEEALGEEMEDLNMMTQDPNNRVESTSSDPFSITPTSEERPSGY